MATYNIKVEATVERDIIVTNDSRAKAILEAQREIKRLVGAIDIWVKEVEEITDADI